MKTILILMLTFAVQAQEHTSPPATIADAAKLAGRWTGPSLGGISEEIWSPPAAGSMVGVYRLIRDGKVVFYELMTLTEEGNSLVLHVSHFNADLSPWEEGALVSFPLVRKSVDALWFDGLIYRLDDTKHLTVFLTMRGKDGTVREVEFPFTRGER